MTAPGKRRVLAVFTPDFDRMTKLVRQHKIVKGGKLQKSESALICVVIAEVSTKALPVFTSILAEWAVLWICTGRNKTFPHSTSLPVMSEIAGVIRHHGADFFIVPMQGSDGRKGSTMNSTATCSTWRGMGSARFNLALDSPYDENKQPYHTGSRYTSTEMSNLLLVHHLRFVEETTSP